MCFRQGWIEGVGVVQEEEEVTGRFAQCVEVVVSSLRASVSTILESTVALPTALELPYHVYYTVHLSSGDVTTRGEPRGTKCIPLVEYEEKISSAFPLLIILLLLICSTCSTYLLGTYLKDSLP